jgi:hypothetical protein
MSVEESFECSRLETCGGTVFAAKPAHVPLRSRTTRTRKPQHSRAAETGIEPRNDVQTNTGNVPVILAKIT